MKNKKIQLKMVHLQVTSQCNLRCSYCGQWGKNGFMKQNKDSDIPLDVWKKTINSLKYHCATYECLPHICIWGGEPLLYSEFDKLSEYIFSLGFKLGMVTNGTLLDKHSEAICNYVSTLYISIEGPSEIHDISRGMNGIFNTITKNIKTLKKFGFTSTLVCLCTINQYNYKLIPEIPFVIADLGFDKLIFQPLMFFSKADILQYKRWMKETFNIRANHADSWLDEEIIMPDSYIYKLPEIIKKLSNNINAEKYPIESVFHPSVLFPDNILLWYSGEAEKLLPNDLNCCLAPWCHLHITSSGNLNFCVDFDDFSAGNILEQDISEIINNRASQKFREQIIANKNPFCRRCPWRFNTLYQLDEKK